MARILITSALPYINGVKHLGNLAGSMLPADVYARYNRAAGHEVLFICATDEHGTPAELTAIEAGQTPAEYCGEQHEIQKRVGAGFSLSFDWFGRSSNEANNNRAELLEWYGDEKGKAVKFAECFEICEYGRQPNRAELKKLLREQQTRPRDPELLDRLGRLHLEIGLNEAGERWLRRAEHFRRPAQEKR